MFLLIFETVSAIGTDNNSKNPAKGATHVDIDHAFQDPVMQVAQTLIKHWRTVSLKPDQGDSLCEAFWALQSEQRGPNIDARPIECQHLSIVEMAQEH